MATLLRNFVELLQDRAARFPERLAYNYLRDGEDGGERLTYGALHEMAIRIAKDLSHGGRARNERALLVYPSGLEFIAAFFGALYAGVIPVPVYPPRTVRAERGVSRLQGIVRDCRPAFVLTCESLRASAEALCASLPELGAARLSITDRLPDEPGEGPGSPGDGDVAFLQYTSGSTGDPKGVAVGHGALFANARMIVEASQLSGGEVGVSWLPLYHDMGLIGGVLSTCFAGSTLVLLSPLRFLQSPVRWLSAISRYRAVGSPAPNFAYELCVEKVTEDQRRELDLSSWRFAFNGAEPVRASTLDRFTRTFAPHGFRREAFMPCYGLAEATLLVSATPLRQAPRVDRLSRAALARNVLEAPRGNDDAAELVGCGVVEDGLEVAIVDPGSGRELGPSEVGEIWIAGTSVASGYWATPEGAETCFGARLASRPGRSFLRTGDLGFLSRAELFVTGRIKDLIIVRGRNIHPQDVEQCAEQAHPAFRTGSGVAFSVPGDDGEEVVLVYPERARRRAPGDDGGDVAELAAAARAAIARDHQIDLGAVVLVPASAIPKTSSGKLQRAAARQLYLDGGFPVVAAWRRGAAELAPAAEPLLDELRALPTERDRVAHLAARIRAEIARVLGTPVAAVDPSWPLVDLGLDSLKLVEVRQRFKVLFGVELSTNVLFGFPTVEALAPKLLAVAGLAAAPAGAGAAGGAREGANGPAPSPMDPSGISIEPLPGEGPARESAEPPGAGAAREARGGLTGPASPGPRGRDSHLSTNVSDEELQRRLVEGA